MVKNKILIITSLLSKDYRHLYSLVSKQEVNNIQILPKIQKFYEDKKRDLNLISYPMEFINFIKKLQKTNKNNIVLINQEVDNTFRKNNIESISLHGNIEDYRCLDCDNVIKEVECNLCSSKRTIPNITLKDEKSQYKQVIEYVEDCQTIIFLGSMGQLDPTLFIDEMSNSLYINFEEEKYNGENPYVEKKENLSDYFKDKKIIDKLEDSIPILDKFIEKILKEDFIIDNNNPYKNYSDEVASNINNYFEKIKEEYNLEDKFGDKKLIKELRRTFPFTKKINDVYLGNIWFAYCNDVKISNKKVYYDDFFYDMLLVYSKYKWEGTKKFFTKRPKISLTHSFINNKEDDIEIFKNLLLKKDIVV